MRLIDAHRVENLLIMCGTYHGVIAYDTVISILHDVPTVDVPETNVGKWIPVTIRCPEECGEYLVTDDDKSRFVDYWHSHLHKWQYDDSKIVAWCELPEPFREGGENA